MAKQFAPTLLPTVLKGLDMSNVDEAAGTVRQTVFCEFASQAKPITRYVWKDNKPTDEVACRELGTAEDDWYLEITETGVRLKYKDPEYVEKLRKEHEAKDAEKKKNTVTTIKNKKRDAAE